MLFLLFFIDSGALSAWSRIKFPHLYVGAVASSGVVNAILDFVCLLHLFSVERLIRLLFSGGI